MLIFVGGMRFRSIPFFFCLWMSNYSITIYPKCYLSSIALLSNPPNNDLNLCQSTGALLVFILPFKCTWQDWSCPSWNALSLFLPFLLPPSGDFTDLSDYSCKPFPVYLNLSFKYSSLFLPTWLNRHQLPSVYWCCGKILLLTTLSGSLL